MYTPAQFAETDPAVIEGVAGRGAAQVAAMMRGGG